MAGGDTVPAILARGAGAPASPGEAPAPRRAPGQALVRLRVAGLNPVDNAIAGGRFYMPLPEAPFVLGAEAVGEVVESDRHPAGARVWCLQTTGCFAEVFACSEDAVVPVPEGVSDDVAVTMGVAGLAGWMPVRERGALRPGETVLVLGAGGVAGQVALQAARAGGAGRVVAAARSDAGRRAAEAAGADAVVALGGGDDAAALREACGGGADLVVDTLWGAPFLAALPALSRRARVVQVGSGAGATAELAAGPLRGGRTDILGFSVFSERPADIARSYIDLASAAGRGEVRVVTERVAFAAIPGALARLAAGASGVKLVGGPPA